MVTDEIGHRFRGKWRFFTILAAMCPITSSSLSIVVLRFEILLLNVNRPLTTPLECSMTAIVTVEHATLLASANTSKCTLSIFCISLAILLGTLTFLTWQVHRFQSFFNTPLIYGGPEVQHRILMKHQIQIHHIKFKFITSNSYSSHEIQIHHIKFKFIA